MPSDLIRGWIPVRAKKTRQTKNGASVLISKRTEGPRWIDWPCPLEEPWLTLSFSKGNRGHANPEFAARALLTRRGLPPTQRGE
jgi:hypothetical protein